MELDRWIAALHARVQPTTGSPERSVLYLRPRLEDLDPYWFTEDAIAGIWAKLRTLNSADRVRKALREFHVERAPPPPPQIPQQERDALAWEDRKAELRRDWDDPQGILRRVYNCQGNVLMLRLLAKLVRLSAPQHLGYIPPHILEAIEDDSDAAPADRHLRFDDDAPLPGARSIADQLAELVPPNEPKPRHLTPEELDRINPLPNGRKRHESTEAQRMGTAKVA